LIIQVYNKIDISYT